MRKQLTLFFLLTVLFSWAQDATVNNLYKRLDIYADGPFEGNNHKFYPKLSISSSYGLNAVGDLEDLVDKPRYLSTEFRGSYETSGRNIYSQLWRFPEWSVGYYGVHLYNDTVFGQPNAVFLGIDVPFNKYNPNRKWTYSYSIAGGLSFNFSPNNEVENPWNTLIGSYNNVFIELGFWANYKINTSFDAKMGLSFAHFSNGASTLPNQGMNMIGPKVLLQYHVTQERANKLIRSDIPEWRKRHGLMIYQAFGTKQIEETPDVNYLATTTALAYKYWWTYKGQWIGQIDLFYDESNNQLKNAPNDDPSNNWEIGLFIGYEAIFNRWSFQSGWGFNVIRNFESSNSPFYQRFGIRYRLWQGLGVGVGLKSQTFAADFIEWGIVYNIF